MLATTAIKVADGGEAIRGIAPDGQQRMQTLCNLWNLRACQ